MGLPIVIVYRRWISGSAFEIIVTKSQFDLPSGFVMRHG